MKGSKKNKKEKKVKKTDTMPGNSEVNFSPWLLRLTNLYCFDCRDLQKVLNVPGSTKRTLQMFLKYFKSFKYYILNCPFPH